MAQQRRSLLELTWLRTSSPAYHVPIIQYRIVGSRSPSASDQTESSRICHLLTYLVQQAGPCFYNSERVSTLTSPPARAPYDPGEVTSCAPSVAYGLGATRRRSGVCSASRR